MGRHRLCQGRVTQPPRGGVCHPSRRCRPQEGRKVRELSPWGRGGLCWSSAAGSFQEAPSTSLWPALGQTEPDCLGLTVGLGRPGPRAPGGLCCRGLLTPQRPSRDPLLLPSPWKCACPGVCGARVTGRWRGAGPWREHVVCTGGAARAAVPRAVRSRVFIVCLLCAVSQAWEEKGRAPRSGHFPVVGGARACAAGRGGKGFEGVTGLRSPASGPSAVGGDRGV